MRICRDCGRRERVRRGLCAHCRGMAPKHRSEPAAASRRGPERPDLEPLHSPGWVPKG